jgi:D-sedoheptulose 7-phosphate isomerase
MKADDGRSNGAAAGASGAAPGADFESLYPFLYGGGERSVAAVLDEARRSTREKAAEIAALRRSVMEQEAGNLAACADAMAQRFHDGGRLYTFGNGGSSTDAQQVATAFLHPASGRPLPALSLTTDVAVVTALSNDIGFEVVFSRQIGAFAKPKDIAFALSTSGGSANVLAALEEASRRGMLTIGLAGYSGGKMAELDALDYLFVIPSSSVHRIQEAQTTIYHALWELTQRGLTALNHRDAAAGGSR